MKRLATAEKQALPDKLFYHTWVNTKTSDFVNPFFAFQGKIIKCAVPHHILCRAAKTPKDF
jgi:hypothetical protein